MRIYLVSLGAGLLIGIIYSLLNVKSPAPPVVALVGLLGMLMGEQVLPVAMHLLEGSHPDEVHSTQRNSNTNSEAEHAHDQPNTDR